jgi:hypothetical protein
MNSHRDAIDEAFHAFLLELRRVELPLDLEPGVAQYLELAREAAFRAGWVAGRGWQEHHDTTASTVSGRVASTVRALVDVGDRAWVQPFAVIEHIATGELFVDPRFTIAGARSEQCCLELVVTPTGLVAIGPTDRHRLSPEIDRHRLRPLARLEAPASG